MITRVARKRQSPRSLFIITAGMHLWPIFAPQTFQLPPHSEARASAQTSSTGEQDGLISDTAESNNTPGESIIQTITVTDTNTLVFLTQTRLLLYNAKPIAPLSIYERSKESMEKFGSNKFMYYSNPYHRMQGLNESVDVSVYKNKIIFYVITDKNFLLVFQFISTVNSFTSFIEYGIEPNLYNEKFHNVDEWINQIINEHADIESNSMAVSVSESMDTEVLSVFDKSNSNRVIQNGYIINKEKNFFQLMKSLIQVQNDAVDEMPIKSGSILLRIVLKFDFKILDLMALQGELIGSSTTNRVEYLCILFEKELHILTLHNYKLQKNEVMKFDNAEKLVFNGVNLFVISKSSESDAYVINKVNVQDKTVYSKEVNCSNNKGTLLNVFNFGKRYLVLLFESALLYFDTIENNVYQTINLSLNIMLNNAEDTVVSGGFLTADLMLLITKRGEFQLYSKWGNLLVQFNLFKIDGVEHEEYTGFSFIDNMIVLTTKTGAFQIFQCWKEIANKSFSNFRSLSQYVLYKNQTNDFLIYQPTNANDSVDSHRVIKLPTKFINNSISKIEINGDLNIMAIYIANKQTLLMTDLEKFSSWEVFSSLQIMDMGWLGNNYLMCYMNDEAENGGHKILRCHDFNAILAKTADGTQTRSLVDGKIWTYHFQKDEELLYWNLNTYHSYQVVTKKSTNECLYNTGEINILIKDAQGQIRLETIDVLSEINSAKENKIQTFIKHSMNLSQLKMLNFRKVKWIYHYGSDSAIFYTNDDEVFNVYLETDSSAVNNDKLYKCIRVLTKVERIVDIFENNVALVKGQQFFVYNLQDFKLQGAEPPTSNGNIIPFVRILINEEEYPIMISKNLSIFHSLQCFYQKGSNFQMKLHDGIFLDQFLDSFLEISFMDLETITAKFGGSKHYMFALEKVLSSRIIEKKPLADILELIDLYDELCVQNSKLSPNEKVLEIVSNSLRKIEANRWSYLFDNSDISPKGLLSECIELNNGKLLGALLMVFLSYEEKDTSASTPPTIAPETAPILSSNYKKRSNRRKRNNVKSASGTPAENEQPNALINPSLIKQVLDILINNATQAPNKTEAHEYWSMAFQLTRFLKVYDIENSTTMTQEALNSIAA